MGCKGGELCGEFLNRGSTGAGALGSRTGALLLDEFLSLSVGGKALDLLELMSGEFCGEFLNGGATTGV